MKRIRKKKRLQRSQRSAEAQPKEGDRVLLCGHEDRPHIWAFDEITLQRPDGTKITSSWFVCCDKCHLEFAKDSLALFEMVRDDAAWMGDEPLMVDAPD
jgi:hypothetical protein